MAGVNARRTAALAIARIAGRRPLGLPATRGFRPVGRRTRGERKVIDLAVGNYAADATGTITLLNGCVQGSDYDERIGRKIVLSSVFIRGCVLTELSGGPTAGVSKAQMVRFVLFVDMQPNGAAPNVTDLLVSSNPRSQLNLNNRDRFKVIKDQCFVFDPYIYFDQAATQAEVTASNQIKQVKCYKKLNMETIFNSGNAGTIGDITSGALYMLWLGDISGGTADALAQLSTRVRFYDP